MKDKKMRLFLAGMSLCASGAAMAQDSVSGNGTVAKDAVGISDIVVTAQRRSESLQAVPVAVTAVEGLALAASGVVSTTDLKLVAPSLDAPITAGYVTPFIRGIGSRAIGPGVENPVAVYVDGVYMGAAASGFMSFTNIERIEVLKGPQGTLFGRNASGGLIQVVTRDPEYSFSGSANLGYGNYDTVNGNMYLTGPIAEGVKADIAAYGNFQGKGYGTNLFDGSDVYKTRHDYGVRSKWLLTLSDAVTVRIAADFSDLESSQAAQRLAFGQSYPAPFGPVIGGSPWDTSLNSRPLIKNRQGGVSARADIDLGFADLVSTTAYRKSRFDLQYDMDVSAAAGRVFVGRQLDRQFSQELQLLSNKSTSPLNWTLGLFYWNAVGRYDPFNIDYLGVLQPPPFNRITGQVDQKIESIAPYAQGTYEFLTNTRLTLGVRYTHEKRKFDGFNQLVAPDGTNFGAPTVPSVNAVTANRVTWRIALDHRFDDGTLLYASQSRGFKSGGFSVLQITVPPYDPETIDAYEIGIKTMLADRRIRINAAGFYYDYKSVQVYGSRTNGLFIANGGKARVKGFEAEVTYRPFNELTLSGGYTYLDSEWTVFPNAIINTPNPTGGIVQVIGNVAGNDLPNAPHHVFTLSGSYDVPIGDNKLTFNGNLYHSSGYFGEPDNVARQDDYTLLNASVRFALPGDKFSVTLWGRNLTDKAVNIYPSHTLLSGSIGVQRANYAPPRTYGITLGTTF